MGKGILLSYKNWHFQSLRKCIVRLTILDYLIRLNNKFTDIFLNTPLECQQIKSNWLQGVCPPATPMGLLLLEPVGYSAFRLSLISVTICACYHPSACPPTFQVAARPMSCSVLSTGWWAVDDRASWVCFLTFSVSSVESVIINWIFFTRLTLANLVSVLLNHRFLWSIMMLV